MGHKKSSIADISLSAIKAANRAQLTAWFEAEFRQTPNPRASLIFLRSNLTWAAQARDQGYEPAKLRSKLDRQLSAILKGNTREHSSSKAGTRLVREWHGKVHEVTVLEKGYRWEGRHYRSLSAIATEITGVKWSGPRFFGLKGR